MLKALKMGGVVVKIDENDLLPLNKGLGTLVLQRGVENAVISFHMALGNRKNGKKENFPKQHAVRCELTRSERENEQLPVAVRDCQKCQWYL